MVRYLARLCAIAVASTLFLASSARPSDHYPWVTKNAPDTVDILEDSMLNLTLPQSHDLELRAAKNFYLRVMPLGASITFGWDSTDGNGYRKWLRDALRYMGWKVNMVGTVQAGTMKDKDNEGHAGYTISQVFDAAKIAVPKYHPNVILINVGSNDIGANLDLDNAGARMKDMINYLFNTVPSATIILSTLIPNRSLSPWYPKVNQQYRDLVNNYGNERLIIADMWDFLTIDDINSGGVHPTDTGYEKMASVWIAALKFIEDKIQAPDTTIDDSKEITVTTCDKTAALGRGPIQTQGGSGHDDLAYKHVADCLDSIWSQPATLPSPLPAVIGFPSEMYFAQLINLGGADRGGETDELIHIYEYNGAYVYKYAPNSGTDPNNKFGAWIVFNPGNCPIGGAIAWGDLNNDGLDDFFCIGPKGETSVSLNLGGSPPKWDGLHSIIASQGNYAASDVRIADIDGDGRADYCIVANDAGDVRCWRNSGVGNYVDFWQGFHSGTPGDVVFAGRNLGDKSGVRLGDLNGDFRADSLYVGDTGSIDTYINYPGWGAGIVPYWFNVGRTHGGLSKPGQRAYVKLARIYGTGHLDYVYFYLSPDSSTWHLGACKDTGTGGRLHKGQGAFYCDMTGTGNDDYVWIYSDGKGELYPNVQHTTPSWQWGLWLSSTDFNFKIDRPRQGIHLADINGDGRCDIVSQRKSDGALEVWRNDYDPATSKFKFTYTGFINGGPSCSEGWGVGMTDRGVRLADMNSDGRADYLCFELSGRITGWLNLPTGWQNVGQIKVSEGWDRANLRLADVNGNGRADIVWVDKYNGQGNVWINNGKIQSGESSFNWANPGVLYPSIGERGANIKFADLGGTGRADYIQDYPLSNKAFTWFNECPSSGAGGDDAPVFDPKLPIYSRPASTPPPTDNPTYLSYKCDAVNIVLGSTNWDTYQVLNAWKAATTYVAGNPDNPNGFKFSAMLKKFFNGSPVGFNCQDGNAVSGGCAQYLQGCDTINSDAGFLIIDSLVALHLLYQNMKASIQEARLKFLFKEKTLVTEFGTFPSDDKATDIINSFLGIAFGLATGGMMGKVFEGAKDSLESIGDAGGAIKDIYGGLLDAIDTEAQTPQEAESGVLESVDTFLDRWENSINNAVTTMFDIPLTKDSLSNGRFTNLWNVIDHGAMAANNFYFNASGTADMVLKSVYSYIIPAVWKIGGDNISPYIQKNGDSCEGDTVTYRDGDYDPAADKGLEYSVCINGEIYALRTVPSQDPCHLIKCPSVRYHHLPTGLDQLDLVDGTNAYGGLTHADFIRGAVASWEDNGEVNGWAPKDLRAVDDPGSLDMTDANMVMIPVCSGNEANENWRFSNKGSNYPCDSPDE